MFMLSSRCRTHLIQSLPPFTITETKPRSTSVCGIYFYESLRCNLYKGSHKSLYRLVGTRGRGSARVLETFSRMTLGALLSMCINGAEVNHSQIMSRLALRLATTTLAFALTLSFEGFAFPNPKGLISGIIGTGRSTIRTIRGHVSFFTTNKTRA